MSFQPQGFRTLQVCEIVWLFRPDPVTTVRTVGRLSLTLLYFITMKAHFPGTPVTSRHFQTVWTSNIHPRLHIIHHFDSPPFSFLNFFGIQLVPGAFVPFLAANSASHPSISGVGFNLSWHRSGESSGIHAERCIPCHRLLVAMLVFWRNNIPRLSVPTLGWIPVGVWVVHGWF